MGGERVIKVDPRVVAATNRDLEAEVEAGRFRKDLYYRLNVLTLRVPPLRERLSDIPELVDHLLADACSRFGVPAKRLQAGVLEALMSYDWARNNVRELRNVVERMVIASDREVIDLDRIPADVTPGQGPPVQGAGRRSFQELKAEAERHIILAALERNDWHVTRTADELGLADHASLLKIMRRHGIKRPEPPPGG